MDILLSQVPLMIADIYKQNTLHEISTVLYAASITWGDPPEILCHSDHVFMFILHVYSWNLTALCSNVLNFFIKLSRI